MAKNNNCYPSHLRYEHKFFISNLTKDEIKSIVRLHPAVFSEIYYERTVNNIYLDSFDMRNYFDNVFGLETRRKVRIRWYGDMHGKVEKPTLELKIKKGLLCSKVCFPLKGFIIDRHFSKDMLQSVFSSSMMPETLRLDLMCLDTSLVNSYKRRYYLSRDGKYRITVDSKLEFYEIASFRNSFLNKSVDHISNIVEIKCNEEHNEHVHNITSYFSFRMTKSSKYVMGLERLNLMKTYSHV